MGHDDVQRVLYTPFTISKVIDQDTDRCTGNSRWATPKYGGHLLMRRWQTNLNSTGQWLHHRPKPFDVETSGIK